MKENYVSINFFPPSIWKEPWLSGNSDESVIARSPQAGGFLIMTREVFQTGLKYSFNLIKIAYRKTKNIFQAFRIVISSSVV